MPCKCLVIRGLAMLGALMIVSCWPKTCAARPAPIDIDGGSSSPLANSSNSTEIYENSILHNFINNNSNNNSNINNIKNESIEELIFVFSIKKTDGTLLVNDILEVNNSNNTNNNNNNNNQTNQINKMLVKAENLNYTTRISNCSTTLLQTTNLVNYSNSNSNNNNNSESSAIETTTIETNSGVITTATTTNNFNEISVNNSLSQILSRKDRNIYLNNSLTNSKSPNSNLLLKRFKSNNGRLKKLNLERNERSANLSHITGTGRKIQFVIYNRFLQLLPDGTVNGTTNELSDFTILQRTTVNIGQIKIQGVATCLFLCMDVCGVIYGSKEFTDDCIFNESIEKINSNTYSSSHHSNERRTLYLALNRHGQPRKVQIPTSRSLGNLMKYTSTFTKTVTNDRIEKLIAKVYGTNYTKHGLKQLCESGKSFHEQQSNKLIKIKSKCSNKGGNNKKKKKRKKCNKDHGTSDNENCISDVDTTDSNSNNRMNNNSSNNERKNKNKNQMHSNRNNNNNNKQKCSPGDLLCTGVNSERINKKKPTKKNNNNNNNRDKDKDSKPNMNINNNNKGKQSTNKNNNNNNNNFSNTNNNGNNKNKLKNNSNSNNNNKNKSSNNQSNKMKNRNQVRSTVSTTISQNSSINFNLEKDTFGKFNQEDVMALVNSSNMEGDDDNSSAEVDESEDLNSDANLIATDPDEYSQ